MVRRGPLWDHAEAMAPRDRLRLGTMHRGEDRLIAGVCSGIAEALHVDPIIVRTAFIILTIAGGFGIPLYLGSVVPHARAGRHSWHQPRTESTCRRGDLRQLVAVACSSAGTLLLLRELGLWFSDAARVAAHARRPRRGAAVGADRRGRAGSAHERGQPASGTAVRIARRGLAVRCSASVSGRCSCSPAWARSSPPTTRWRRRGKSRSPSRWRSPGWR